MFILILTLVFMLVVLQLGKIASNDNYRSENNHLKTELKETKQENKKLQQDNEKLQQDTKNLEQVEQDLKDEKRQNQILVSQMGVSQGQ